MRRDHRLDTTTAMLTQMRGDAYPPTPAGIRLAVLETVPHVLRCEVYGRGRERPERVLIDVRLPWWAGYTLGVLRVITRRRILRVFRRYSAAGMSNTLVEVSFTA